MGSEEHKDSNTPQQVESWYEGRVQGVGFRYTVLQLAQRIGITGRVENLEDGRVHLVAEGPRAKLDQLLHQIRESRVGHGIHDETLHRSDSSNQFSEFHIQR